MTIRTTRKRRLLKIECPDCNEKLYLTNLSNNIYCARCFEHKKLHLTENQKRMIEDIKKQRESRKTSIIDSQNRGDDNGNKTE